MWFTNQTYNWDCPHCRQRKSKRKKNLLSSCSLEGFRHWIWWGRHWEGLHRFWQLVSCLEEAPMKAVLSVNGSAKTTRIETLISELKEKHPLALEASERPRIPQGPRSQAEYHWDDGRGNYGKPYFAHQICNPVVSCSWEVHMKNMTNPVAPFVYLQRTYLSL